MINLPLKKININVFKRFYQYSWHLIKLKEINYYPSVVELNDTFVTTWVFSPNILFERV